MMLWFIVGPGACAKNVILLSKLTSKKAACRKDRSRCYVFRVKLFGWYGKYGVGDFTMGGSSVGLRSLKGILIFSLFVVVSVKMSFRYVEELMILLNCESSWFQKYNPTFLFQVIGKLEATASQVPRGNEM